MNRLYRMAQRWSGENPATVALTALGVGLVAAAFAGGALYKTEGSLDTIIKRSPCASDPASPECKLVQREVLKNRPLRDACITARKIDRNGRLLRLTKCILPRGGVVPQQQPNNPPASQQPGPGSDRGDGNERPAPRSPRVVTPTPTAPKPSQPAPVIVNPPPVPSTPAPSPPAPIRETVEGVTDKAGEVVCSVPVELCP